MELAEEYTPVTLSFHFHDLLSFTQTRLTVKVVLTQDNKPHKPKETDTHRRGSKVSVCVCLHSFTTPSSHICLPAFLRLTT